MPLVVKTDEQVTMAAKNMANDRIVPVFTVSNVTGEGLDKVRAFMNLVSARQHWSEFVDQPAEFRIDETFMVPGVGT